MSWITWSIALVITAGIFYVAWRCLVSVFGFWRAGPSMVCTTCGHHGPTKTHTRGSFAIEIVAWLCFLFPGLIYSLWRLSSRRAVCAGCGADTLVPTESPIGRRLLQDAKSQP